MATTTSSPRPALPGSNEKVVLVDELGAAIGTADKATVHTTETPLHLAFSCYAFDTAGRFLLTRRALTKPTWPGVWTNTCCGHPAPGEPMAEAIRRRLHSELGLRATAVDLILPAFRYRAQMANGIIENELCPVYRATVTGELAPNPSEVAQTRWCTWNEFQHWVTARTIEPLSPWCELQLAELTAQQCPPQDWPTADPTHLPAAARTTSSDR